MRQIAELAMQICDDVLPVFKAESRVLQLSSPIYVFGARPTSENFLSDSSDSHEIGIELAISEIVLGQFNSNNSTPDNSTRTIKLQFLKSQCLQNLNKIIIKFCIKLIMFNYKLNIDKL